MCSIFSQFNWSSPRGRSARCNCSSRLRPLCSMQLGVLKKSPRFKNQYTVSNTKKINLLQNSLKFVRILRRAPGSLAKARLLPSPPTNQIGLILDLIRHLFHHFTMVVRLHEQPSLFTLRTGKVNQAGQLACFLGNTVISSCRTKLGYTSRRATHSISIG